MRKRVLWIEDEAYDIRAKMFAGPVYTSGKYNLEIVRSIKEAVSRIYTEAREGRNYNIIIIDIRFEKNGQRLGLELIEFILGAGGTNNISGMTIEMECAAVLKKIDPCRLGVLTIEKVDTLIGEMSEGTREKLRPEQFAPKMGASVTALLDLLDTIAALPSSRMNSEGE